MLPTDRNLGLQAVIMCGEGEALQTFAQEIPKALLPIANAPMVTYPLEWCQKAGVKKIIIAVKEDQKEQIEEYFKSEKYKTSTVAQALAKSKVVPQIVAPEGEDEYPQTADVIRYLFKKSHITGDFVVLPCDLIVEGIELGQFTTAWMIEQVKFGLDAVRKGGLAVWYMPTEAGEKPTEGIEIDLLGVTRSPMSNKSTAKIVSAAGTIQNLAYLKPAHYTTPLKRPLDDIQFRHSFIKHYGNVKLVAKSHRDAHIYIFPYWVGELIAENDRHIGSLARDLLPQWTKALWNKRTASRLQIQEILSDAEDKRKAESEGQAASLQAADIDIESMSTTQTSRLGTGFSNTAWAKLNVSRSNANSGTASPESSPTHSPTRQSSRKTHTPERPLPTITAIVAEPTSTAYIKRVDTPPAYLAANLHLAKSSPSAIPSGPPNQPDPRKVDPSCQISGTVTSIDSVLGAACIVEQRAVVKRCVLGANVVIEKGARVLACVLLDGARVKENARLESCVVGRGAVIGKNANLKDCRVAPGLMVEDDTDEKSQDLQQAVSYDDYSDEEEDEEDDEEEIARSDDER